MRFPKIANQEFQQETKEEQIIAESCKRLIENAIICWNYLYLSEKLADIQSVEEQKKLVAHIKQGSIITWQHRSGFKTMSMLG